MNIHEFKFLTCLKLRGKIKFHNDQDTCGMEFNWIKCRCLTVRFTPSIDRNEIDRHTLKQTRRF